MADVGALSDGKPLGDDSGFLTQFRTVQGNPDATTADMYASVMAKNLLRATFDTFKAAYDLTINDMQAAVAVLTGKSALTQRAFTVQDGGADPLFSYNTTGLANGTIVIVSDLGGCGANATPGKGLVVWMGEWRRLSRGLTATLAPGTTTLDAFKDPMRIAYAGSLLTVTRAILKRPFLTAKWSFVRPGLGSATAALGVGLDGAPVGNDVALVGAAVNFIEYTGSTLTRVEAE